MSDSHPTKVAVLGGGVGAMAAAFELTRPELGNRFEVTVYQPGWRLGGKGASGRRMTPNGSPDLRIEEHGLHVWFGFYENAFTVMRDAYEELVERGLAKSDRFQTVWDAFEGCNRIVVFDRQGDGWARFPISVPPRSGKPGDGAAEPSVWEMAAELATHQRVMWSAVHLLASLRGLKGCDRIRAPGRQPDVEPAQFDELRDQLGVNLKPHHYRWGQHLPMVAEALATHPDRVRHVTTRPPDQHLELFADLMIAFRDYVWEYIAKDHIDQEPRLRLYFTMLDAWACGVHGVAYDRLTERGFDAINDVDLCDWLRDNTAKDVTLGSTPATRSPMLRAIYDLAFAYANGRIADATAAAGTAVSDFLRLFFAHSGSLLYKMQAGMGDAVFAPLYRVLRERGVKFEFFHAVTELGLSADQRRVETITVVPQVTLAGAGYEPVFSHDGVWCWPDEPFWDQLEDGGGVRAKVLKEFGDAGNAFELNHDPLEPDVQPQTLQCGRDFDHVVLGISVGALRPICQKLIEANPRFRAMVDDSVTTPTQAFQLWLDQTTTQLGWHDGRNSVAGCYVEPMDTYCDMSHLIPRENWPPEKSVRSVAYFCGVLDAVEGETQPQATERVKKNAERFMNGDVGPLWPKSVDSNGALNPALLVDGVDDQYYRANISGSELYVLTPPAKVRSRLRSDDSGFDNLVLAGDWTLNGIDAGCVESAASSGRQAARKLTGTSAAVPGERRNWLTEKPRSEPKELKYIEYGALETAPGPFRCTGARFRGFLLPADRDKLEHLFRRTLTHATPGPTEYHPLGNHVALMVGRIDRIESVVPTWASRGSSPEWQVTIAVPVLVGRRIGGVFLPTKVAVATPYMLVDNPLSLCGGREVFGYPKVLGQFPDPLDGWWDRPVEVKVFGGNFGPEAVVDWLPLINVTPRNGPAAPAAPGHDWNDAEDFIRHLLSKAGHTGTDDLKHEAITIGWPILERLVTHSTSDSVFLKQFRDHDEPDRSCFRQVISAPLQITELSGRVIDAPFEVKIERLDSHPIVSELGLSTAPEIHEAFELQMNFVLGAVEKPGGAAILAGGIEGHLPTALSGLRRVMPSLGGWAADRAVNASLAAAALSRAASLGSVHARNGLSRAHDHYRALAVARHRTRTSK